MKKCRNFFGLFKTRHPRPKRGRPAPRKYRQYVKKLPMRARKAEQKFRQFWGVQYSPELIKEPGLKGKNVYLAGMGKSPGVYLADAPEGRERKRWTVRGRFLAATDPSGRRIFLLNRKGLKKFGKKPRFVGYAYATRYIPTGAIEKAGSHKSNKIWVHEHGRSERGRWPKVYKDAGGSYLYARGTYSVSDWIRN